MNSKDIEQQINDEYLKILNGKYTGHISVPKNLVELFKKAVMALPPYYHKLNFTKIQGIVIKSESDLTNGDLNEIIKLIFNTPLDKMFDDIFVAIPEMIKIEKFAVSYNTMIDEHQRVLEAKSQMLQSLTKGVNGKNNMRIIPNGQA